ncbi:hypothetical protein CDAR_514531 [Caerostris darwini]|uniref:Uncharacterized protein n=2 Tax=Caerostris TaxID=172845 RepID=A0AAV4NDG9_9ARAC|nr:hypothetical protein CEXT_487531 [Caerostris extrusa]GIX82011.1 hypothetical protein CDAR_514531 [Caerostris darwini]
MGPLVVAHPNVPPFGPWYCDGSRLLYTEGRTSQRFITIPKQSGMLEPRVRGPGPSHPCRVFWVPSFSQRLGEQIVP